jgi:methylenetetrahydrofolate reductase (NADPH)
MNEAKTPSKLEKILRAGHLAVTSECGPPRGSEAHHITKKAEMIKNHVDAINITDNQTSVTRLCSLASCIHLKLMGLEPVLQMVTRDRNRIALQSDILGAASFDIFNILVPVRRSPVFRRQPQRPERVRPGFHAADSDRATHEGRGQVPGRGPIERPPRMFVGAAANPFADPFEIRVPRLAKKIAAGVEFIQTQCIYNVEKFELWLKLARDRGLTEKVFILAGVTPFKSVGMAKYMKNRVPGMDVPDEW